MLDVVEIHVDRAHFHDRAGNFGTEMQRDAFVRLDVNNDSICGQTLHRRVAKQHERRGFELYDDRRMLLR